jgi:NADPH-dependent glutamate synthase beta subunit-like oxidoreductase
LKQNRRARELRNPASDHLRRIERDKFKPLPGTEFELDQRGNVRANMVDYQTSRPNLFSAGDMRRGQSLVVWAIR